MKAWILAGVLSLSTMYGMAFAAEQLVDINTATAAQLEAVKGIGPKMASEIVKYRTEHQGFKSLDELKQVRGVGDKTFMKLSPHLTVTPPATKSKK
ncbi:ComEA family DNA-binding protein [Halothiobacillus sp. DCM-1]|uniref:ComEA family DNA-binding protein n=1 Tax=Halothiobacillus sp. DCM-1 TaxID=3112558 RepID=UPI00324A2A62